MDKTLSLSHLSRRLQQACVVFFLGATASLVASQLDSGKFKPLINELEGQTLFAFDDVSIPFTRALKLRMHAPEK